MFQWLRKQKEPQTRLKEVEIGDGNMTVDLPVHFIIEQAEDSITIVHDPDMASLITRFSVLYISDPQGSDAAQLVIKEVQKWAKEHHQRVIKNKQLNFVSFQESFEEGESGDGYYWIAGLRDCLVFVSCFVNRSVRNEPLVLPVLNAIEAAVRSLRESKTKKYKYDGDVQQEIQALIPEQAEELEALRQAAIDAARVVLGRSSFMGGDSDLQIIQAMLDHPNFDKSQQMVIEGLGVFFGGILARKLDLQWVSVKDEYGSTPALQHSKANIMLYPKDMLIKRIERGEVVDITYLLNTIYEQVQKMVASKEFDR